VTIEIYYFTGTGNSLAVARKIAGKTDGTLLSISAEMAKPRIQVEADAVGIVFPCYLAQLYGIPLIVEKFVGKLENIKSKYVFAVCTYGYFGPVNALPTLGNLAKIIRSRGGRLSGAFSVRLPPNNLDFDHVPVPLERDLDKIFKTGREHIDALCRAVILRKHSGFRISKSVINVVLYPMYAILHAVVAMSLRRLAKLPVGSMRNFREVIPLTDNSIRVDEQCNGCGICEKVCPVTNISNSNGRPEWLHHCEMCFACDEWCPQGAIHHWGRMDGRKYHHPDISIDDMLRQRGDSMMDD
jgi:flavodoxin/ferredoxin